MHPFSGPLYLESENPSYRLESFSYSVLPRSETLATIGFRKAIMPRGGSTCWPQVTQMRESDPGGRGERGRRRLRTRGRKLIFINLPLSEERREGRRTAAKPKFDCFSLLRRGTRIAVMLLCRRYYALRSSNCSAPSCHSPSNLRQRRHVNVFPF